MFEIIIAGNLEACRTEAEIAEEKLSHYVNRRGDNVPIELTTAGALAMWLMVKDDGTVMGRKW